MCEGVGASCGSGSGSWRRCSSGGDCNGALTASSMPEPPRPPAAARAAPRPLPQGGLSRGLSRAQGGPRLPINRRSKPWLIRLVEMRRAGAQARAGLLPPGAQETATPADGVHTKCDRRANQVIWYKQPTQWPRDKAPHQGGGGGSVAAVWLQ